VGSKGKRDVEQGEGLNGPLRRKMDIARGAKTISRMGGIPGMIDMRKEVRGNGRGGECELKGMKGLRMIWIAWASEER
jgi:hypothetical protein